VTKSGWELYGRTSWSTEKQGHLFIAMITDCIAKDFGPYRRLAIISSLVHEALHAFLMRYSCWSCRMSQPNRFAFGCHGRAWQLLALQLEESFAALLSVPLKLLRRTSLICHLKVDDALQTPHDLECYKLRDGFAGRKEQVDKLAKRMRTKYHSSKADQPTYEDQDEDIDPIVPDAGSDTPSCRTPLNTNKSRWFVTVPSRLLIRVIHLQSALAMLCMWLIWTAPSQLLIEFFTNKSRWSFGTAPSRQLLGVIHLPYPLTGLCMWLTIPEAQITDNNVAMHMGYGESRCVAERVLLQVAHKQCGIPVSIIRTGQIGGPSSISGECLPVQGWLLTLCRASRALGALPMNVAPADWLPVGVLAQQISDVVMNGGCRVGYRVLNLVHPDVQPWDLFLETLINRFGLDAEKIGLPEWLNRLEEKARSDTEEQGKLLALKIADFMRSLDDGMEDMRCVGENIGEVSTVEAEPLSMGLLEQWLRGWTF
jgi:hypothetical protein